MYKQHFPMLNSIWPKIGLGPLFYSGIKLYHFKISELHAFSHITQCPLDNFWEACDLNEEHED